MNKIKSGSSRSRATFDRTKVLVRFVIKCSERGVSDNKGNKFGVPGTMGRKAFERFMFKIHGQSTFIYLG